jgi:hypothetical protein
MRQYPKPSSRASRRSSGDWCSRAFLSPPRSICSGSLSDALGVTSYTDCDNLAGECLRIRQQFALRVLGLAAAVSGLGCLWSAARALVVRAARWQLFTLIFAIAFLGSVHVVDPVEHLDNRRSGWFSDPIYD